MMKWLYFFIFLCNLHTNILCEHKIIYLISPPRSCSVAFLRMMQATNHCSIIHEPSQLPYILLHYPNEERLIKWFLPSAPRTFEDIKAQILKTVENENVFVKEMSYAVRDFLLDEANKNFIASENIQFVFLIRNPHHAIISRYKKSNVRGNMSYIIGYKASFELFEHIKKHSCAQPIIVRSEDLYNTPNETAAALFHKLQIPFKEEYVQWDDLGDAFLGNEEWCEVKHQELTYHYHADAIHSTRFFQPTQYEVDETGEPTFSEIEDLEHREICKKVYQENLPYYQRLVAEYESM